MRGCRPTRTCGTGVSPAPQNTKLLLDRSELRDCGRAGAGENASPSLLRLLKYVNWVRPELHFAVGTGTRAQAYVIATNGYRTLAPINWYANEQKWDLNPGYAEHNYRFVVLLHFLFIQRIQPLE
jgi:hypothetical protein